MSFPSADNMLRDYSRRIVAGHTAAAVDQMASVVKELRRRQLHNMADDVEELRVGLWQRIGKWLESERVESGG